MKRLSNGEAVEKAMILMTIDDERDSVGEGQCGWWVGVCVLGFGNSDIQCSNNGSLRPRTKDMGSPFDLVGELNLCEVDITVVEDLAVLDGNQPSKQCWLHKENEGRPRKKSDNLQVSDSMILDHKDSLEVEKFVWNIGLELGVSGVVAESEMIQRLADMETRDRIVVGRPSGLHKY
ncbi:DUF255 domain-containing protein [Sesbania bispinosa]|nr:DUF255 domain-containing protein [Sesbania bispinosa]